jgi:hypothetical protein
MSGQPWLSPGFLLSLLAALLLMIAVSCGTSATATPEPAPDADETATVAPIAGRFAHVWTALVESRIPLVASGRAVADDSSVVRDLCDGNPRARA